MAVVLCVISKIGLFLLERLLNCFQGLCTTSEADADLIASPLIGMNIEGETGMVPGPLGLVTETFDAA